MKIRKFNESASGLTEEEKNKICGDIDEEGFSGAFLNHSEYPEIKDAKFHLLRNEFIKAQRELSEYIGWDDWD